MRVRIVRLRESSVGLPRSDGDCRPTWGCNGRLNQSRPQNVLGMSRTTVWRSSPALPLILVRFEDFGKVTEAVLIATCNAMKLQPDAASRAELMEAYLRPAPFADGSPAMLDEVVRNAGLNVISVDGVKTYKPSTAAYPLVFDADEGGEKRHWFCLVQFLDCAAPKPSASEPIGAIAHTAIKTEIRACFPSALSILSCQKEPSQFAEIIQQTATCFDMVFQFLQLE